MVSEGESERGMVSVRERGSVKQKESVWRVGKRELRPKRQSECVLAVHALVRQIG